MNENVIQVCCCVFPDGTVFWTDDVQDGPRLAVDAWRSTLADGRGEELMEAGATLGCVAIRMTAESYAAITARTRCDDAVVHGRSRAMSKLIEGCPQPETPIRDRAWTAEQAIANLLDRALDAAAFLNAIKRNDRAEPLREAVHAVWPESAKSMDARFHLSSAFAATLCQPEDAGHE